MAPGKRVTSSMAPLIVLKDGRPQFALGLPGGLRIFTSALQTVLNLIDHGMTLQQAVEAPRIWTQGYGLELEPQFPAALAEALTALGHSIERVPNVGGGMGGIRFLPDGDMEGAACWRADGTAIGMGGGLARSGAHPIAGQGTGGLTVAVRRHPSHDGGVAAAGALQRAATASRQVIGHHRCQYLQLACRSRSGRVRCAGGPA